MRKFTVALLVTGTLLGSAAIAVSCSSREQGAGYDVESDEAVAKSRADMALSWASLSEWDRDQLCLGLEGNGWDSTREGLRNGASPEKRETTNWDAAVAYVVERCAERSG